MTAVLDATLADFAHRERHTRRIAATPEEVWDALWAVTGRELLLTRILVAIRRAGTVEDGSFVRAFLSGGRFTLLSQRAPGELVAGAAMQPWRLRGSEHPPLDDADGFASFDRPGFVRVATSFEVVASGDGTVLATETRVAPTDRGAALRFAPYWLAIRAGSGLIRRDILRAVDRRAAR